MCLEQQVNNEFSFTTCDGGAGGSAGADVGIGAGAITSSLGAFIVEVIVKLRVYTQSLTIVTINEDAAKKQNEEQKHRIIPGYKQDSSEYQYWEASLVGRDVVIGKGLTIIEASARVSIGLSIMCANQDAARWILALNAYFGAVGPEIHGGAGYYYHYHPHRHTHTHIWYYD